VTAAPFILVVGVNREGAIASEVYFIHGGLRLFSQC